MQFCIYPTPTFGVFALVDEWDGRILALGNARTIARLALEMNARVRHVPVQ